MSAFREEQTSAYERDLTVVPHTQSERTKLCADRLVGSLHTPLTLF